MSSNPAPAKTKLWQDKYSYIKVRRPRIGTSGFFIRTATEKWTIMTHAILHPSQGVDVCFVMFIDGTMRDE